MASFPVPHRMLSAKELSPLFFFLWLAQIQTAEGSHDCAYSCTFFSKTRYYSRLLGSARQRGKLYRSLTKEVNGCFWFVTLRIGPIVHRVRCMNGAGCTAEPACSSAVESQARNPTSPLSLTSLCWYTVKPSSLSASAKNQSLCQPRSESEMGFVSAIWRV